MTYGSESKCATHYTTASPIVSTNFGDDRSIIATWPSSADYEVYIDSQKTDTFTQ